MSNILDITKGNVMHASFEERSAWVTLVGLIAATIVYLTAATRMLGRGVDEVVAYVPLMIGAVILLVLFLIVGHIVAAIGGTDRPDERDRLIAWRAEHHSAWIVGIGAITAVFMLAAPGLSRALIANLLIVAMFAAEIVNYALQLFFYRRGV